MDLIPKNYGDFTADDRRKLITKLAQESIKYNAPKFKIKRFKLDKKRDRTLAGENSHEFGSIIKSFWVCDWSGNFSARIVPNHKYDRDFDSGLPLRKNMAQPLEIPVSDACLEFEAQPGAWIEIAYSDTEDIQVGNVELSISGKNAINEGSSHASSKKTVTTVAAEIIPANGERCIARLQYKSGGSIWVGNPDELADADYKNICQEVKSGDVVEWRNTGALFAKTDVGTVVFSLFEGIE